MIFSDLSNLPILSCPVLQFEWFDILRIPEMLLVLRLAEIFPLTYPYYNLFDYKIEYLMYPKIVYSEECIF